MLKRLVLVSLLGVVILALPFYSSASSLTIYMTGLHLGYDGETIYSMGGVDPLTSAQFVVDDVLVGFSFATDADLRIGGVYGLETSGTQTTSTFAGHGLDLFFNDLGGFLDLDWDSELNITLDNNAGTLGIHGTASTSDIGQDLPFGLEIGVPVSVTFSQTITYVETGPAPGPFFPAGPQLDPSYITYFESHGTGEITGPSGTNVPEPGTLILVGVGIMGGVIARRRRHKHL